MFDETAAVLTETTIEQLKRGTESQGMDPLVLASLSERFGDWSIAFLPFDLV